MRGEGLHPPTTWLGLGDHFQGSIFVSKFFALATEKQRKLALSAVGTAGSCRWLYAVLPPSCSSPTWRRCADRYFGSSCALRCPEDVAGDICGGHGLCTSTATCSCYGNASVGYWAGTACTVCQSGVPPFPGFVESQDRPSRFFHVFFPLEMLLFPRMDMASLDIMFV